MNLLTVIGTVTDTGTNGMTYLPTQLQKYYPANFYLFKINERNTEKRCEWRRWRRSDVFIVFFKHISNLFLVFLLLTLNWTLFAGCWSLNKNNMIFVNIVVPLCFQNPDLIDPVLDLSRKQKVRKIVLRWRKDRLFCVHRR